MNNYVIARMAENTWTPQEQTTYHVQNMISELITPT